MKPGCSDNQNVLELSWLLRAGTSRGPLGLSACRDVGAAFGSAGRAEGAVSGSNRLGNTGAISGAASVAKAYTFLPRRTVGTLPCPRHFPGNHLATLNPAIAPRT